MAMNLSVLIHMIENVVKIVHKKDHPKALTRILDPWNEYTFELEHYCFSCMIVIPKYVL